MNVYLLLFILLIIFWKMNLIAQNKNLLNINRSFYIKNKNIRYSLKIND